MKNTPSLTALDEKIDIIEKDIQDLQKTLNFKRSLVGQLAIQRFRDLLTTEIEFDGTKDTLNNILLKNAIGTRDMISVLFDKGILDYGVVGDDVCSYLLSTLKTYCCTFDDIIECIDRTLAHLEYKNGIHV